MVTSGGAGGEGPTVASIQARPTDPFAAIAPGQRYAAYADLARAGAVQKVTLPTGVSAWLVTQRDEVRQVLTDPGMLRGPAIGGPLNEHLPDQVQAALASLMIRSNPPEHTRLRRLVGATFTRGRVESLVPRIQHIAGRLLDVLEGDDKTDLIESYAYPLPMTVICELMGVPEPDRDGFHRWSASAMAGAFVPQEVYVDAYTNLDRYVRGLLKERRAAPTDDLISALVAVRDGGDQLSDVELVGLVILLVVAGHETTVNLIGSGVHALLTEPDQLALVRAEPHRLPVVVEELLRFASPVQVSFPLVTTVPVRLGDVTIPAGEVVVAGLLSANRDPAWVEDPARLDVTRGELHHLGFGHGIHHCLGAALARTEGQIAIGTLLERFPQLRLAVPADDLRWKPGLLPHGLAALPVALS